MSSIDSRSPTTWKFEGAEQWISLFYSLVVTQLLLLVMREEMHRLAVKSNLIVDSSSVPTTFAGEEKPVCPKPRRLGVPPEFLNPPPRCIEHSRSNAEERSQVLAMIAAKEQSDKGWELGCCCCSQSCLYSGSPPTRTDNALVHDVHFLHQRELLSPFMRTKLSDGFGFASASPI